MKEIKNKDICYIVEANSFEKSTLWEKYSYKKKDGIKWENSLYSKIVTICTIDNSPVCISLQNVLINNQPVLFWEATSQMVDYQAIEKWLKKEYPQIYPKNGRYLTTDPTNFHTCIFHIEDLNNSPKQKLKEAVKDF